MLLKVDCLPNAVGKQPSIPLIYLGRKWTLNWWWWWWQYMCQIQSARLLLPLCNKNFTGWNFLPVSFKLGVLVYRCMHGLTSPYLAWVCFPVSLSAGRNLCSAVAGALFMSPTRTVTLGPWALVISYPTMSCASRFLGKGSKLFCLNHWPWLLNSIFKFYVNFKILPILFDV